MIDKAKVPGLLYELCVDLGYCLPFPVHAQIEDEPPQTIDAFTDAVFIGEGMDKYKYPKSGCKCASAWRNTLALPNS